MLALLLEKFRIAREIRSPSWFFYTLIRRKKVVAATICGVRVHIRTRSHDYEVARDSLGKEYSIVFSSVPETQVKTVIDAGGYIGTASIAFARRYPNAKVIALEPSSENFKLLKMNVAAYGNIVPLQVALSDVPGSITLYDAGTGEWGFSILPNAANEAAKPIDEIRAITVSDLMASQKIEKINILKLDIEGAEAALLSNNVDWIRDTDAICIELHDRIVPGCSKIWHAATAGRRNVAIDGEKNLSIHPDIAFA